MTSSLQGDLAPQLGPDLELIRPVGEGATARVFLAREPSLQRLVAVKLLRAELAADAVVRRRFEREAQSAARISHAHVTRIHRVGRLGDDVPYIVMEYVDGRTVREVLDARGRFEPAEARALLAALASALAAAHDTGIIHRDVRPENVFIENRSGRAVLADFGIAALLESGSAAAMRLTAAGVRLGDVRHMSPEQVRGEPLTEQSDVYAFGVLAYEVLTGQAPFAFAADTQVLVAHLEQQPPGLRAQRPDLEPGIATLLERCLAKDPQRRPRAAELARALTPPPTAVTGPAADDPLALLLEELRRRRVYKVLVGYGAFALALLGGTQAVYEAFGLPVWWYRGIVIGLLVGFPAALVLSWVYDLTSSGIVRTRSPRALPAGRFRALLWGGLGASILVVALVGWLLIRG